MDILDKAKQILSSPMQFFETLKEEPISGPYLYVTLLGIPAAILTGIVSYFTQQATNAILGRFLGTAISAQALSPAVHIPLAIIESYVAIHIAFWLVVSIFHLFILIVRGTGTYSQTAQIYAYGNTPSYLFGWIPLVGMAASIWSVVLYFIGSMRLHELSPLRATLAIIVFPLIIFGILAILMITAGVALLGTAMM